MVKDCLNIKENLQLFTYDVASTCNVASTYDVGSTYNVASTYDFASTYDVASTYNVASTYDVTSTYNLASTYDVASTYGQTGTTCRASSQDDLNQNSVLETCMLRFSLQKCRKRSFLRQKRAVFLASNVRSASRVSSYQAVFPDH